MLHDLSAKVKRLEQTILFLTIGNLILTLNLALIYFKLWRLDALIAQNFDLICLLAERCTLISEGFALFIP